MATSRMGTLCFCAMYPRKENTTKPEEKLVRELMAVVTSASLREQTGCAGPSHSCNFQSLFPISCWRLCSVPRLCCQVGAERLPHPPHCREEGGCQEGHLEPGAYMAPRPCNQANAGGGCSESQSCISHDPSGFLSCIRGPQGLWASLVEGQASSTQGGTWAGVPGTSPHAQSSQSLPAVVSTRHCTHSVPCVDILIM